MNVTENARARELAGLDRLEGELRALLGVLDTPGASAEAVATATESWARVEFDPNRFLEAFRGAEVVEVARAREALSRLNDLDALVRDACRRGLNDTADAIEKTRALRAQLSVMNDGGDDGELLDFTH